MEYYSALPELLYGILQHKRPILFNHYIQPTLKIFHMWLLLNLFQ